MLHLLPDPQLVDQRLWQCCSTRRRLAVGGIIAGRSAANNMFAVIRLTKWLAVNNAGAFRHFRHRMNQFWRPSGLADARCVRP